MRILTLLWISLLYLPVLMVSGLFFPYLSRGPVVTLLCAAVSASAVFSGSFIRFVFCRAAKADTKIMFFIETAVTVTAVNLVLYISGIRNFVFSVYISVMLYMGMREYDRKVQHTVSDFHSVISFLLYLFISVAAGIFITPDVSFLVFVFPYIAEILIWIFLRNSANINNMMASRHYSEKYMPSVIWKQNRKLAAVLCAVTSAMIMFYRVAEKLFRAAEQVIADFLIFIFKNEEELVQPEEVIKEAEEQVFKGDPANAGLSGIMQILFYLFAAAIAVCLFVYAYRTGIFYRASIEISAFFRSLFSRRDKFNRAEECAGFTDIYEDISNDLKSEKTSSEFKRWRKKYRKYSSEPGGEKKFRYGYGLAAEYLRLKEKTIAESDTPYEISDKVKDSAFSECTEIYCSLRYGENTHSSEELRRIDDVLKKCSSRPIKYSERKK